MKKKNFREKGERTFLSERAEAMPAAIVTAIISSFLLLGIATAVSLVVQNKADSEGSVALTAVASNIDVSLRSDITEASYLSGAAKLKQPAERLLTPTDVLLSGVNMHIPESSGECKVVRWNINGNTASRDLTIYQTTVTTDSAVKCNETSAVIAQRTKVFAKNVEVRAPFEFSNQVGRKLAFNHVESSLSTVNAELDRRLTEKGVDRLSDAEFNELNGFTTNDSYTVAFLDPAACVLNAQPVNGVCPPAEADTVAAAWNSTKIAKIGVDFQMQNSAGEIAKRDIAQNASVPLYADAAEAEAAVAGSSADNRPVTPIVSLSTNRVILGANYTINWTSNAVCPADTVRSFKLYENNSLIRTQSTAGYTKNYTNSATEFLNYNVQVECVRGALVVNSDMSAPATAKVIPAVPALSIINQPALTDAPLNSNITADAVCLYGTTPRYNVVQAMSSYGTPGSISNLASVNRAINSGLTVVEGARYQYRVDAWCVSSYDQSDSTNTSTAVFTTLINTPSSPPPFTSPLNGATNVSPTILISWNDVICATGTTVTYRLDKTMNAGNTIARSTLVDWSGATSHPSNNTEGNRVGYALSARCEGTAVVGNPTPDSTMTYTTFINTPSAPVFTAPAKGATGVATNATLRWTGVTCATATTTQYYMVKNMNAGASITPVAIENWTTNVSSISNNNQGNTVGYSVMARCAGPNANSSSTVEDTLSYTTLINAPLAPAFTAPANNATGVSTTASLTWSAVTCATGTAPRYYMVKDINAGASITPIVIDNWTTNVSNITNNTEGNRVGYSVAARCDGPNANSVSSASNAVTYTTQISTPTNVAFIDPTPVEGSVKQPIDATLTWSAATCGPGTTAKYYTTKDVNGGQPITPIVIDNWTTDLSYTTYASEGHTVRYNVKARCDGPNVISGETATDYRQYTTLINAPSGAWAWNDNYGTVLWNAPSVGCAPATNIQYRLHQTVADGGPSDAWGAWDTDGIDTLPSYQTGGYPQWAEVQSRCVGPNDTSAGTMGNTTKWIKRFDISFSASLGVWRRVNVEATCPYATSLGSFHLYVAADGWGGARGVVGSTWTDEGAEIADSGPGGGGNTGWIYMNQQQNTQWDDVVYNKTTYNWGYWGASGYGSHVTDDYATSRLTGTYWNANGWGAWAYWYTGHCATPYMNVYAKGTEWHGGGIRNAGNPGAHYDAWPTGHQYTQAGNDAVA